MMSKERRSNYLKSKSFLTSLRSLVDALPTDSDKSEIQSNIRLVVDFLTRVQNSFKMLPTSQDMNAVKESTEQLEKLFTEAEANPVIANVVGLRARSTLKKSKPAVTTESIEKAKTTLAELEALPIDEIRSRLQSETCPVSELRALASLLRIGSNTRLSRDTLAHQITMKIANYRGYKRL